MAKNEYAEESPDILAQINELWDRAKSLTTSERMRRVTPEEIEKYRQRRENAEAIKRIDAWMKDHQKNTGSGKAWAWLKGVLKHASETADKIRID